MFLRAGLRSSNILHRLLCVKITGELLVHIFGGHLAKPECEMGGFDTSTVTQWAVEILNSVLESCNDIDHQVRIGATSCVGHVYGSVFGNNCSQFHDDEMLSPLRESLCSVLLRLCQDPIGTVRTEGGRVLGEVVAQGLLAFDQSERKNLTLRTLTELQTLMHDSKLAARMQAVWALGNMTQDLLPQRLLMLEVEGAVSEPHVGLLPQLSFTNPTEPHFKEIEEWKEICGDELWTRSLQITHSVINTDSEKMMPATVRLLAMLCCGIGDFNILNGGDRVALMLNDATTCLLQLIFGQIDAIPTTPTSVTVGRQPTILYPWLSKQWTTTLLVENICQNRSHLLKVLFSMCQLAGALVWRVAREHSVSLVSAQCRRDHMRSTIDGGVRTIMSNSYRCSFNFLINMMKQDTWQKISQAAIRGLTLACSSYECGIVWDTHYCCDQLLFLATTSDHSLSASLAPMTHFLKSFEIPLQIRCLETTLLLLVAPVNEKDTHSQNAKGLAPVYAYWKHCSTVEDGGRPYVIQPQGELALLLLLHSNLRLLRVILSSAKERWLLASSTCAADEGGKADSRGVSREDEQSMDIVTTEYERVTSILFHSMPDLLRQLYILHNTEYSNVRAFTVEYIVDNDPCIVFLDDYFQHMALLDICLSHNQDQAHATKNGGLHGNQSSVGGGNYYGEGSKVISRRRLVSDVLEMVLQFFSLTGQDDLLASTNMTLDECDQARKMTDNSGSSLLATATNLLGMFRDGCSRTTSIKCTCCELGHVRDIEAPIVPDEKFVQICNDKDFDGEMSEEEDEDEI